MLNRMVVAFFPPYYSYTKRWQQAERKIMEDIIATFFQELIPSALARIGAFFRWIFLRKKYNYKEVLKQKWNGRVGLLFITLLIVLLIYLN